MSQRLSHQNAAQGNASREVLLRRKGSLRLFWWVGDQDNTSNQCQLKETYADKQLSTSIIGNFDNYAKAWLSSLPFNPFTALWLMFHGSHTPWDQTLSSCTLAAIPELAETSGNGRPQTTNDTAKNMSWCWNLRRSFTIFHSEYTTVIHCDWPSGCVHYHVNVPNMSNQRWSLCLSWSKTELFYSRDFCSSNAHMFFVISLR